MKINDFHVFSTFLKILHRNSDSLFRLIECPNASKSIGNGFPMKKYIGAVLRKSCQLVLTAEVGPFEIVLPLPKNVYHLLENLTLKKNKTI